MTGWQFPKPMTDILAAFSLSSLPFFLLSLLSHLGFSNRFEFAVYGELNPIIDGKAAITITKQIFKEIEPETKIVGWKNKPNSERKMGLAVYDVLQENTWPDEKIEETISSLPFFLLSLLSHLVFSWPELEL